MIADYSPGDPSLPQAVWIPVAATEEFYITVFLLLNATGKLTIERTSIFRRSITTDLVKDIGVPRSKTLEEVDKLIVFKDEKAVKNTSAISKDELAVTALLLAHGS
ncbi:hypothetical protein VTJ49DRAFT_731 [Mycothermus thermophilus]|uniref:Uncharacterized protein n=1 Tax=Humicola insolens TaxID=85995 RepID=A0ABR3VEM1_HUMIN